MSASRGVRPDVGDAALLAAGALVAVGWASLAVFAGPMAVLAPTGGLLFLVLAWAFGRVPHVMLSGLLVLLVLQPMLLKFVSTAFGPAKDVLVMAAAVGVGGAALRDRRAGGDLWIVAGVGLLLLVYLINPAGGHGSAWFNGTRIVAEALLLLLVGLLARDPRRTWRWALVALLAAAVANVLLGLVQRKLGVVYLVETLEYTYGREVRETSGGVFRAFGTFEEPFSYAAVLLFALTAAVTVIRPAPLRACLAAVLIIGIADSVVRTALVLVVLLIALAFARHGRAMVAVALASALLVAGLASVVFGEQKGSSTPVEFLLTLNGRTESWTTIITTSRMVVAGRGVGDVGVGARRAEGAAGTRIEGGAVQDEGLARFRKFNVDSSYLATVADVGVIGLAVLLAVLGRILFLALRGARAGVPAGWAAFGLLAVMVVDGFTRSSLTAFPSGYIGLLVLGLSIAVVTAARREGGPRPAGAPRRPAGSGP